MNLYSLAACLAVLVYCTSLPQLSEAKIFSRCDLARRLSHERGLRRADLATWVCIAYHESRYNTAARSKPNKNGSRDHGLFQINDKYWCTASGPPGRGCKASCAAFENDDISDDVKCIEIIYSQTKRAKRNGFLAWSTYGYCNTRAKVAPFLKGCGV